MVKTRKECHSIYVMSQEVKQKTERGPGYYNHLSDFALDNGRTTYYIYLLKVLFTMLQSSSLTTIKVQVTRGK